MNEAVKNIKLHLVVLALVVVSEFIGIMTFKVGPGKLVLLPMLYAMFIGIFLGPKFFKVVKEKDMFQASTLVGLTLLLLMARYGTLVGPKFFEILKAGPALILQEFGNIATLIFGVPIAMYLGLKREAVGAAHSIAREPNVGPHRRYLRSRFSRRTRCHGCLYLRYCFRNHLFRSDGPRSLLPLKSSIPMHWRWLPV